MYAPFLSYVDEPLCQKCYTEEKRKLQQKEEEELEKAIEPGPLRKCHDCGKPTANYRCYDCWRKRGVEISYELDGSIYGSLEGGVC